MATLSEPFLINPRRRKRGRKAAAKPVRRRRRQTVAVASPKKSHRRRRRSAGVGPSGSKHRPVVYSTGRRWRTSPKSKIARPGVFLNPGLAIVGGNPMKRRRHRKSYRRNPVIPSAGGIMNTLKRTLPLAVTGVGSSVAVNLAPNLVGVMNPWAIHGVKTAVAVLGGPLIGKMLGSNHGDVWTVVGISVVVADLIKQFMPGVIPGLSGYADYNSTWGYGGAGVSAFPQEVSAYPEEVSGYGDTPWPYAGAEQYGY